MKKAFIVTFEVSTRVVVDVPENFGEPIDLSKPEVEQVFNETVAVGLNKILSNPRGYLDESNASLYSDTGCPYNPDEDICDSEIQKILGN